MSEADVTVPMFGASSNSTGMPTIGRYVVVSILGRGGMGVVYGAYDPVLDRKIAVKLLHRSLDEDNTDGRARMHREAQALARLSHPNVITVHDVSEQDGTMYIAMELVAGCTLGEWQKSKSWRQVIEMYLAAARGLAAAHAAELIHRDFKPENVLVGDDGRVRVTDFGLARLVHDAAEKQAVAATRDPEASGGTSGSRLASNLTAEGMVMGTPSYMAPEQIDNEPVDARADQFSWCLALWEAIYGEQPWPRGSLALRSAAMRSDVPKVPSSSPVPRGVAKILLRGLAPEPAKRWPSMDALAAVLGRATSQRGVVIAGGAVAVAAALGIVFVVGRQAGATRPQCELTAAPVEGLWSATVQDRVRTQFTATQARFAQDALVAVDRSIGGWLERWRATALESCRATHEARTQSEAVLDLRSACLVRRRDELRTVIAALETADARLVERAPALTLPDLETCNDAAVLAGTAPPPAAMQAERAKLEGELEPIERELVDGLALERARQLDDVAKQLVARAKELAWAPLIARARIAHAGVQRELGSGKPARSTLIAAAADASAANDLDQLVAIYTQLIDVEQRLTSDYALGDGWATLADGTLKRLGPRVDKQLLVHRGRAKAAQRAGRLEDARDAYTSALALAKTRGSVAELLVLSELGIVEGELGDLATATAHLERAHELARKELGKDHPMLGAITHDLATITFRKGSYVASEAQFRASLAIRDANRDELETANTLQGLGTAVLHQGRIAEAQQLYERALAMHVERLGEEHPDVANALNDVGAAYHRAGEYERELATNQRALAIREKALGPDHPDVGQSLVNVAIASKALEQWEVVIPNYRRAIAIFEKAYGSQHLDTAITRLNFAEALRVQSRFEPAVVEYEAARLVFVKQLGEEHPILSHVWNGVGQLELARGKRDAAVPLLERAVAMREKDANDVGALAESRFALARALGKADPRALTLAKQSADAYRDGKNFGKQLAAVEAWLK